MEYPTLYVKEKSRQMSDDFRGYNHNLRISDSEFYDMKNMTSDYYPVLAPRGKRGVYADALKNLHEDDYPLYYDGLIAKDKLCYVTGPDFVIGTERVSMELNNEPKQLISMGSYVIIMPDRKYINTVETVNENGEAVYEHGKIDVTFISTTDVKFTPCTLTGDAYFEDDKEPPKGETAPGTPENGQLWIDTSSIPHTLKKYSKANEQWVSIPTTYIKISSKGIAKNFKQYDGVKISGITIGELNGSHALWGCHEASNTEEEDYIIITGFLDRVATQKPNNGAIFISRKMPKMDFIVESNNRLWGCRYGFNNDGVIVNEIYASKLGDFKNWNCFMNLSTDSYTVSCGTDGPFTGAITHLGFPLFFKENCVHKVYGDYPANFRVQDTACRGVQKGSSKSLAIVNETLYYKSGNAVCAYDGSLPVEMSTALGETHYSDAVAGAHGNKYYITMKDAENIYHLFVYDTAKGMWHKEDNLRANCFCSFKNELYAIEKDNIITMLGSGITDVVDKDNVPWMVETGLMGMSMPDMKYISKLVIRMSLEVGANVEVSIQYDSIGDWEQVCQMTVTSLRSFSVPVRPRRCDHFRIRIEGEGKGKIYSITKTIEQGSDVS